MIYNAERDMRERNENLRRQVCSKIHNVKGVCELGRSGDCAQCATYLMDHQITQTELAQALYISTSVITNVEGNRSRPNVELLYAYSQLCGCKMEDLLVVKDDGIQ